MDRVGSQKTYPLLDVECEGWTSRTSRLDFARTFLGKVNVTNPFRFLLDWLTVPPLRVAGAR